MGGDGGVALASPWEEVRQFHPTIKWSIYSQYTCDSYMYICTYIEGRLASIDYLVLRAKALSGPLN